MENQKIFCKVCGYDRCQDQRDSKKDSCSHAKGIGHKSCQQMPSVSVALLPEKQAHRSKQKKKNSDAPKPQTAGKQLFDISHVCDLTVREKFPVFPVDGGNNNLKVISFSAQISHHFIGDEKKVIHGHIRQVLQNLIAGIFFFIISGGPVGDGLDGGDQKHDHKAEGTQDPRKKDRQAVSSPVIFTHFSALRLITFNLVNSSRSFSSRAFEISVTRAW